MITTSSSQHISASRPPQTTPPIATAPPTATPVLARAARIVINLAIMLAIVTAGLVAGTGTSDAATTRARIAEIAEAEVGKNEADGSCLKFGPCTTTPWCAYFTKWVWKTAGITELPDTYAARGVGLWAQERGQFSPRPADGIGNPEVGDLAVYGTPANATGGHIGVITAVHSNGTLTTVDGNYGDKVARRTVDPRRTTSGVDSLKISGYVKPTGVQTPTTKGRVFHNLRAAADGNWTGAGLVDGNAEITDTAEAGDRDGRLHVLPLLNGQVFHNVRGTNGQWTGASLIDGNGAISKVAAATTSNDDLHVLTLLNGRVFHNMRTTDGQWTGAQVADDNGAISDIAAAGDRDGRLHVLTLLNGQVFHNVRGTNGQWTGASLIDGNGAISKVAAATTSNDDLHVLTLLNGRVFHNMRTTDGQWTGAQVADDNGAISDIAAAGDRDGRLHVLTLLNGRVFHNMRGTDGQWTGASVSDPSGRIVTIAAATTPNGDLHQATLAP
ncbi:CHAP domain-containing protein [Streptomyces sp. UG1]|uniref:CHAP domain-containing protein n=1 Tax=Streptomyces sp. UG1 TaxID=3417652 RepID=UPI003CF351DB